MQTGLSIQELAAKIAANETLKRDYIADTSALTMQVHEDNKTVLEVADQGSFPIQKYAHDQIAERLKIPQKYYDRMQVEAPDLLATNVNAWFRKYPEKRMVRTLGGDARAFLSNRYQRIDNNHLANAALPVLAEYPEVRVVSSEVTDRRMYIQAVFPRLQAEVKKGDVVQAGVAIRNSEIGHGAVGVDPLVFRLICLNGMIGADGKLRGYHVGGRVESSEELWADDTKKADDRAILLKVRDTVKAALTEARFTAQVEKLRGFTTARITGDPTKAVEVLAQTIDASETEKGGILRSLIEGGDLSAWGLMNAVTAQAHKGDYDRAVELEAAGGALVDLAPSEWKRVLEAS